jgi:uncharacterized protein (DUF2236 family)
MRTADPITRFVRASLSDAAPNGVPGLRDLVGRGLAHSLQGPRPGTTTDDTIHDPGDPGLCGPGSASWTVLDDIAGLVGGVRALLLQTLHPLAMAGVTDHSSYESDPFGRLHRTGAWVATTSFGSLDEALAVTRLVRGQHRKVTGTAPDGRPYAAGDARLLAWVSITFTDSLLRSNQMYGAHPVDPATADRYVLEQSRIAALLDPRVDLQPFRSDEGARTALRRWDVPLPLLDEGALPHDVESLRGCLEDHSRDLARSAQADEALRFLAAPGLPAVTMPAYRAIHLGAMATLPEELRVMLGHPRLRGIRATLARRQTGAMMTAMRLGTGHAPAREVAERRVLAIAS